jgi:hypothetical protein
LVNPLTNNPNKLMAEILTNNPNKPMVILMNNPNRLMAEILTNNPNRLMVTIKPINKNIKIILMEAIIIVMLMKENVILMLTANTEDVNFLFLDCSQWGWCQS